MDYSIEFKPRAVKDIRSIDRQQVRRIVFTYDEFLQIQETLADHDDLQMLRAAKRAEKEEPTVGLEVLKGEYGLNG